MSKERINAKDRLNDRARLVGIASTKDNYELEFTVWSENNNCAAANIRLCDSGRKIWGVLYEIPWYLVKRDRAKLCRTLDNIEGEGKNYLRKDICVKDQNGNIINKKVQTYLGKGRKKGIRTSLVYVAYIIKGLRDHNIPNEYIEYVKMRAIENNPDLKNDIFECNKKT